MAREGGRVERLEREVRSIKHANKRKRDKGSTNSSSHIPLTSEIIFAKKKPSTRSNHKNYDNGGRRKLTHHHSGSHVF